jgi:hypothetical protein
MFLMCNFKKIAHMADCSLTSCQFLDNEDALTEASTVVGSDETIETTSYKNLQRVHWLTVHCGPHITLSSLQDAGIHADGCHAAACERGGVITYIHLSTRCRQPALAKFLQYMPGCTSARVVDTLNDKTLVCTPEFLDLLRLLGHGCVTSDGTALGLLSRYLKPTGKPSSKRTDENAELRQRIAAMEKDRVDMEQRLRLALHDCAKAEDEIGRLRSALSRADDGRAERESELKRLRIENTEFRRLGAEEKEVRRLNRELMTLQDQFEEKARDCKVLEMTLRIAREDNAKLHDAAKMAPRPSNYLRR